MTTYIRNSLVPVSLYRKEDIMNSAAKLFSDYLEQRNVKYSISRSNVVSVGYTGENCPSIRLHFFFGEDGRDVAIRSNSIVKIQKEKGGQHLAALIVCSELNKKYRWIKFYLNDDNEIIAEDDAVIEPHTTGEECYKLLQREVDIIDEAYPGIMRAIWGIGSE